MSVVFNPFSWLRYSTLLDVDGIEFFDLPNFPQVLPQKDDIYVVVGVARRDVNEMVTSEEEIRIDLLSYRIYKNPHLWWVIALRNGFELMPSQLHFGQKIICPSPRYVFNTLLQRGQ